MSALRRRAWGMFIGLLIFCSGHATQTRGVNRPALRRLPRPSNPGWLACCIAPVFFTLLLVNNSVWLCAGHCSRLRGATYRPAVMVKFPEHQCALWQIVLLMITGSTFFWVLAQQGGSSISLFIDRFVNRHWLNMTSHRIVPVGQCDCGDGGVAWCWRG